MTPTIRPYDLGAGRAQAFVYHDGSEAGVHVAVQPDLGGNAKRSREIEAHHYDIKPPRTGQKWCLWPYSIEDIDEISVRAQQRFVEGMEPSWVEHVKELWMFYRDFTSTVFWSELEPETVMAILRLLMDREEIPPDGDWN
ncbi:hypothetical protein BH18ACT11_BH18ACT11_25060 [soil metagenome]